MVGVALALPWCFRCRGTGWCVVLDDECSCTRRDQVPAVPLAAGGSWTEDPSGSLPGSDVLRLGREISRVLIAAKAPAAAYSADRLAALVSEGRGPRTPEAVASYAQVSMDIAAEVFEILAAQRREEER